MEPKELVHNGYYIHYCEIVQCDLSDENIAFKLYSKDNSLIYPPLNQIEGKPISAEWITKIGLSPVANEENQWHIIRDFLRLYKDPDGVWWVLSNSGDVYPIEHVHRVQALINIL